VSPGFSSESGVGPAVADHICTSVLLAGAPDHDNTKTCPSVPGSDFWNE
jgi:hypothetical protein